MPIDVIKVRMQYSGAEAKVYSGLWDAVQSTVRKEGLGALFKGLPPALIRQARVPPEPFGECQVL